jgi:GNAT superfamily N-acetyltransferase
VTEEPFTIRNATPADRPAVRAFVLGTTWSYGLTEAHDDLGVLGEPFNGALAELVAVRDGEPIGVVTLWPRGPRTGWIAKLFVDPDHRRMGIARALVRAAVGEAREYGLTKIGLSTLEVLEDAVRFYERTGWIRGRGGRRGDRIYWLSIAPAEAR